MKWYRGHDHWGCIPLLWGFVGVLALNACLTWTVATAPAKPTPYVPPTAIPMESCAPHDQLCFNRLHDQIDP